MITMGRESTGKFQSLENMTLKVHNSGREHACTPLTFEQIFVKFEISMPEAIKRANQKDQKIQNCRLIHGDKKQFIKNEDENKIYW